MNKRDLQQIRANLEESHRKILAGEFEEFKEGPGSSLIVTSDEMDFANSIGESSLRGRLHDRKIRLLHKIEEALERIENGEFGICEVCDESIGVRRLKVRPIATLCIPCKEEQEREKKTSPDERYRYPTRSIIHDWA